MTKNTMRDGTDEASSDGVATAAGIEKAASHTPAPWDVYDQGIDDGDDYGCHIQAKHDPLEDWIAKDINSRANARLIASAPDLLAALKNLLDEVPPADAPYKPYDDARAAIAKAEGRP